eukprot:TRINITY_DN9347_c0_g1_i2.p1 TRINITY_DN9347_c0_g1~~TRINITY_DN9347_c0_g1_i2.p1  ORF type:complete len:169 (+),score=29.66 TRINITY_DN9347_c0_g1_i2:34-507(+)
MTRGEKKFIERWPTRSGIALCLRACTDVIKSGDLLKECFEFFMTKGLADSNDEVWGSVLEAGLRMIDVRGQDNLGLLLPMFEEALEKKYKVPKDTEDRVKEGIVILMGTIARHMPHDSPKIGKVVDSLVGALKTPSYKIGRAVQQECRDRSRMPSSA